MKTLRVLHVCTSDRVGGAARAAHRIHLALRQAGIDSHMLVLNRTELSPYTHEPGRLARIRQRLNRVLSNQILKLQGAPTNKSLHSLNLFNSGLGGWINSNNFDVVNLHWLGDEMLSINEIADISHPVVWTMHDMWSFCGAEHYDDLEYPQRYVDSYSGKTRPKVYQGIDVDRYVWQRKKNAWSNINFHLISPSRWLGNCAKRSALMSHLPCSNIPNCVDTEIFKPIDRIVARKILNLDPNKRYILFGAMSGTDDPRKGFHLLQAALQLFTKNDALIKNTELLILGSTVPHKPIELGLPITYMGYLNDDISLAVLYSACDVFLAPAMQDNLPNTIVEAMACGTPSIAFDIGGMPDLIKNGETGILIPPFDLLNFSSALDGLLKIPLKREVIRDWAVEKFSPAVVSIEYGHVYAQAISHKKLEDKRHDIR